MSFKDLIKDVTGLAKDSYETIQSEIALKTEEQKRLRNEMDQRIKCFTDGIMEQLNTGIDPTAQLFITASDDVIVSYTSDFFDKLLLPANSSSATKIDMHPYEERVLKTVSKTFPTYNLQEKFLFRIKDSKGQILILTTSNLYFKIVFPENNSFFGVGFLPKEKLFDLSINEDVAQIQLRVNNIPLITSPVDAIEKFDIITLSEYLYRIKNNDFIITDDQVNAFIQSKIDPSTLEILKPFIETDDKLVYFAWGLDTIDSKKFIICTNKKIVLYEGDPKALKHFNYDEIASITTQQSAVSFLDLSLTLGMNPNDMEIHTIDSSIEKINILYSREAEKVIQIYNRYKKDGSTKEPQETSHSGQEETNTGQSAVPQEDPIAMIEKLAALKEKGIITEEEFNQKKKDLLDKL